MSLELNIFWAVVLLAAGLLILLKGADMLVDGAAGLAKRLRISPLVIGLTIVAMGTSAPEVAASIAAVLKGFGDAAVGNVYGSNIANLALVGGVCAVIHPIMVNRSVIRRDMPVMFIVALILWPLLAIDWPQLSYTPSLGRVESVILLGLFFAILIAAVVMEIRDKGKNDPVSIPEADNAQTDAKTKNRSLPVCVVFIIIGLAGLAAGADLTVTGAVFIGYRAGLSEAVIGLTIIAVGTSLPELMTCIVASSKGQDDLSIGNLVGSNIFNTLLVIGAAGVVRPFSIDPRLVGFDYWVMILFSAAFIVIAVIRQRISRLAGLGLVAGYGLYIGYLVLAQRPLSNLP